MAMPEKPKKAVALRYSDDKQDVPRVAGKGRAWLAEKIIEIAKEHNIPLHKDEDLVEILDKLEVDQEIPLEVYAVVAEVFAYLYRVNKQRKKS